jgi:hypothetical protein
MNDSVAFGWPELAFEYALETQAYANITSHQVARDVPTNDEINATLYSVRANITGPMDEWLSNRALAVWTSYNSFMDAQFEYDYAQNALIEGYYTLKAIPIIHQARNDATLSTS